MEVYNIMNDYLPAKYRLKSLNDKEWEALQKRVIEKDAKQANLIGVNIFEAVITIKS